MMEEKLSLRDWIKDNCVEDTLYYKSSSEYMIEKFEKFAKILGGQPFVVGTHTSKSILLPVIEIETSYGIRCILRDNFHDINISVWCPVPCEHDLFGLASVDEHYLFFQGFKEEWKHEPFTIGAKEFSVVLGEHNLISFAHALFWVFFNEEGKPRDLSEEQRGFPNDPQIQKERVARFIATNSFFPLLYRPEQVSATYRFFKTDHDILPNEDNLRTAFTRQGPGFSGKISSKPIKYLTLNFCSGCPEPIDEWLTVLNKLVKERRMDDFGVTVFVRRMTLALKARAQELGCLELLLPSPK